MSRCNSVSQESVGARVELPPPQRTREAGVPPCQSLAKGAVRDLNSMALEAGVTGLQSRQGEALL